LDGKWGGTQVFQGGVTALGFRWRTVSIAGARQFELVINAQTARVLGLTVAPSLLASANGITE
jgi:hypothetical protein